MFWWWSWPFFFREIDNHLHEGTATQIIDILSNDRPELIESRLHAGSVARRRGVSRYIVAACMTDCFASSWKEVCVVYIDWFLVKRTIRVPNPLSSKYSLTIFLTHRWSSMLGRIKYRCAFSAAGLALNFVLRHINYETALVRLI